MKQWTIAALLCLGLAGFSTSVSQTGVGIPEPDRVRIAEARRLSQQFGTRLWKEWNNAPFALLLVTPENEYLVHHPRPSGDFKPLGYDSLLGSAVFFRPRVYPMNFLATFPAVGGIPTIVIGQAENTSVQHSSRWIITVMHEHIHQIQFSRPGYYEKLADLRLDRGDTTGMWVLNFPFPYDSKEVAAYFDRLCRALARVLNSSDAELPTLAADEYFGLRDSLRLLLSDDEYRYLSFQLWQEGIPRYAELRFAELFAREYIPSDRFRALDDYASFSEEVSHFRRIVVDQLENIDLPRLRRTAFYAIGAAEAMLLDRINEGWRERYFEGRLVMDELFPR